MKNQQHGKWRLIRTLGSGGQCNVFVAFDVDAIRINAWDLSSLFDILVTIDQHKDGREGGRSEREKEILHLKDMGTTTEAVGTLLELIDKVQLGALKTLKDSDEWTRDPEHVKQRLQSEIAISNALEHPNILKVVDSDITFPWLVTEYHRRGTLVDNISLFQHDPLATLRAFRGLVSAVDSIHDRETIHRDIKPENIFLATDGRLVLGDFGLALSSDANSRPTVTGDNAGTYQWMPVWAMNVKHDFMPTFDVYALAKILWFMLAPSPGLPPKYEAGDISTKNGNSRIVQRIEGIVKHCVVLEEENCIPDIKTLLSEVDSILEEPHSTSPAIGVDMVAHAMTRPGGLYLMSIEASTKKCEPDCCPEMRWRISHPKAAHRGKQMPGISDPSGLPAIPDADLWKDFVEEDVYYRRSLIRPPNGTWNETMDCEFQPIPIHGIKYIHLAVAVGERSPFGFYLRFEDKWVLYSNKDSQLSTNQTESECKIVVPELSPSESVHFVVRDLQSDLCSTWHTRGIEPEVLDGIRFRGEYRLLFLRVT